MKVFVTGVAGQLGHDVINELTERTSNQAGNYTCTGSGLAPEYSGAQDGTAVTKAPYVSLDITDEAAVERVLLQESPDVVVHCAAWTAVDLAEALGLEGAGEGDQGGHRDVEPPVGHKGRRRQAQRFKQHRDLPPVEAPPGGKQPADPVRQQHAQEKGGDGRQVRQRPLELPLGAVQGQQHQIARFAVGEHAPAAEKGIGFQKSADDGQQEAQTQGFGHLAVKGIVHRIRLSTSEWYLLYYTEWRRDATAGGGAVFTKMRPVPAAAKKRFDNGGKGWYSKAEVRNS